MNKIAYIFSGQGSQYIGMGKKLYDNFPECRNVFDETDKCLGIKLSEMILKK